MKHPAILGRLHVVLGLTGLAVFLGTGLYMDRSLAHLVGMPDAPRALYRSGHIYILSSALLHLMLGAYVTPREYGLGRAVQYMASTVLVAALVLFMYGFVVETPLGLVERPRTRMGIELSLAGTLLHCLAAALFRPYGTVRPGTSSSSRVIVRESDDTLERPDPGSVRS